MHSVIGNYFSPKEKIAHIKRNFKPGCILYLYCWFTNPPKDKYCILIDKKAYNPMLFIINSNIPSFIAKKPEFKKTQITIDHDGYEFLDHKSYINCYEVIKKLTIKDIKSQLKDDIGRIKGPLLSKDRRGIIDTVKKYDKTISPFDKKLILQALNY